MDLKVCGIQPISLSEAETEHGPPLLKFTTKVSPKPDGPMVNGPLYAHFLKSYLDIKSGHSADLMKIAHIIEERTGIGGETASENTGAAAIRLEQLDTSLGGQAAKLWEMQQHAGNSLVQFIDSYDPPLELKGFQEDLNFMSPRIGEVLEAVGTIIFLSMGTRKFRHEGFLSPHHPQYPEILTNSAYSMRAQDLANVTAYRERVLFGYLVCLDELLHVTSSDIAWVVLQENLVLTLFKYEYILLHEHYQLYVLPRILESKKMSKSGYTKQKEADLEYNVAKQVEKMIREVHKQAILSCDDIHHERRILLKQEIGRMVLFFTNQPNPFAPNIQMVFSALVLAQCEVIWYFHHVGTALSKSLIDSIMGALEGLINILDSEGGFGALENPKQAASYLNYASIVSIISYKSPTGAVGSPLPGHESFPENNSSIKMLEAAMQRLTNWCSVLNDMEPICVLNHIFILREYMRECIEEATSEDAAHVRHQFPSFCLEDKAILQDSGIDRNANQQLGHKLIQVYQRHRKRVGQ